MRGSEVDAGRLEFDTVEFVALIRIPLTALPAHGRVAMPVLEQAHLVIDVLMSEEVEGPWTRASPIDPSRLPAHVQAILKKPEIDLALRTNYGGLRFRLLDEGENDLTINRHSMGPAADGTYVFWWPAHPRFSEAWTLEMEQLFD